MQLLSHTFRVITYCGYWIPPSLYCRRKKFSWQLFSYKCYGSLSTAVLVSIILMKLVTIAKQAINKEFTNIEDIGMGMFLLPDTLCSVFKCINLRVNRDKLLIIERVYTKLRMEHNDKLEVKIQERFDTVTRYVFMSFCIRFNFDQHNNLLRYITYGVVTYIIVAFTIIASIMSLQRSVVLPGWYIYEISSAKNYWWTMFHQFLALNNYCIASTMFDTVVVGIMMQICAQLDILTYRIFTLTNFRSDDLKHSKIVECINHHILISR